MKKIIIPIVAAGILLKVLFTSNDLLTKIIVVLFLVYAVAIALRNVLVMMNKEVLANKVSKIYVVAFLIYWFGFLIYWDYVSFVEGNYLKILFSVPLWLGGLYFTYKRLLLYK